MSETDDITVCWTGADGTRRRLRFRERSLGGWERIEQRYNTDEWVTTGKEIVTHVGLDAESGTVVDGQPVVGD